MLLAAACIHVLPPFPQMKMIKVAADTLAAAGITVAMALVVMVPVARARLQLPQHAAALAHMALAASGRNLNESNQNPTSRELAEDD